MKIFGIKSYEGKPSLMSHNIVHITKGTVFFFFGNSLTFSIFGQKSSEWVKMVYFFFHCCIFFRLPENEWVSEMWTFPGKKKYKKLSEKKNTPPKLENLRKLSNLPFLDLFLQIILFFSSEWLSNFSWKKKYNLYFFGGKKKYKILPNRVSEWGTNFSGKKKIRYLCRDNFFDFLSRALLTFHRHFSKIVTGTFFLI